MALVYKAAADFHWFGHAYAGGDVIDVTGLDEHGLRLLVTHCPVSVTDVPVESDPVAAAAVAAETTRATAAEATNATAITTEASRAANAEGLKATTVALAAETTRATAAEALRGVVVVHGSTASTARPSGAVQVHWIGSVAPTNAATNDEWTDTTTKAVKRWNGSAFDLVGSGTSGLVPTAVKTSAYTAAPSDLVPVDTTSGNVTITLPTAPADKTQIGVKHVVRGGTNTVSVAAGGADRFNVTGGSATLTLTVLFQSAVLQYVAASGLWYVVSTDIPLGQLDARFLPAEVLVTVAASGSAYTVPAGTTKLDLTLTANCVVTLPAPDLQRPLLVRTTQGGVGGFTATFVLAAGGNPKWGASGVPPTLTATAGAQDELAFHSWGTSWTGGLANKDIK